MFANSHVRSNPKMRGQILFVHIVIVYYLDILVYIKQIRNKTSDMILLKRVEESPTEGVVF